MNKLFVFALFALVAACAAAPTDVTVEEAMVAEPGLAHEEAKRAVVIPTVGGGYYPLSGYRYRVAPSALSYLSYPYKTLPYYGRYVV